MIYRQLPTKHLLLIIDKTPSKHITAILNNCLITTEKAVPIYFWKIKKIEIFWPDALWIT